MRRLLAILLMLAAVAVAQPAGAQYPWLRLPPTPTLPKPETSGIAPVNGIRLWYAEFGHGAPVILVHGGLANSNYWGLQVPVLAAHYHVIVLDSRGHGPSTRTDIPIGYDLMSSDVLALMDYLHIRKAALIGWSDGAIIGLDIAIHHPERLTRLFAFAANSDPSGVKDVSKSPVFTAYIRQAAKEYAQLSPTPTRFTAFRADIEHMWASEPHFTDDQLSHIKVPTWIVDADHDEAIKRENTDHMAALIPGSGELILPEVSHFAFLQDPVMFNESLLHFLSAEDRSGHRRCLRRVKGQSNGNGLYGKRLESFEPRRDSLNLRKHVRRQIGRDGGVDAGKYRVAQPREAPLDSLSDLTVHANGREQMNNLVADRGGHLRPFALLR